MPGYVLADVTVSDPETYAGYRARTPGTVAAFGGRFLVRGGAWEAAAGAWAPGRLVFIGFESRARAAAWYDSPAYTSIRAIRRRASTGNLVMIEGARQAQGGAAYAMLRLPPGAKGRDLAHAGGGRVLAADAVPEIREGDWPDGRLTVLEFDEPDAARAWLREDAGGHGAGIDALLVEGAGA